MNGISHQPKYNLGQNIWFVRNGGVYPVTVTKIVSELRNDQSITDFYHIDPLTPFVGSIEGAYEGVLGLTPEEALIKAYGDRYQQDGIKKVATDIKLPFKPMTKTEANAARQRALAIPSNNLGFAPA